MGDVTLLLLDGKHRVAESVFGWSRNAVEVGINEFQTGISLWATARTCRNLAGLKLLVINLDNGPECNGHRSQFLQRMTEFADMTGLCVRLVYYPPYHSKYNAIERYWAGLEKSWNGYLLSTVDTVLNRAGNFFWKKMRTVVQLLDAPYEKGIKVCGNAKTRLEQRLLRFPTLRWWDITNKVRS